MAQATLFEDDFSLICNEEPSSSSTPSPCCKVSYRWGRGSPHLLIKFPISIL
jgi:hypothetical protein